MTPSYKYRELKLELYKITQDIIDNPKNFADLTVKDLAKEIQEIVHEVEWNNSKETTK